MEITNSIKVAADMIVKGTDGLWLGKVFGVASAFPAGIMSYDPNAASGNGALKGAKDLYKAMLDAGYVLPEQYESQISKIAKGLLTYGAWILAESDDDARLAACETFCRQWTLNALSEALYPKKDKERESLATLTGRHVNVCTSERNGYSMAEIFGAAVDAALDVVDGKELIAVIMAKMEDRNV